MDTETLPAICLVVLIFDLLTNQYLTETYSNYLLCAGTFVTVATTLWTTILIAYRIHSVSKHNIPKHAKQRFYRILEIIMQSSIVYSLVLVVDAVSFAIPQTESNTFPLFMVQNYIWAVVYSIAVF